MDLRQTDFPVHETNEKRSIFSSVALVDYYLLSRGPFKEVKEEILEMEHEGECPEKPACSATAHDLERGIQTNQGVRGTVSTPTSVDFYDDGGTNYQDYLDVANILGGEGDPAVEHYTEKDVLAGRGSLANNHPGNKWYLLQKERLQPFYLATKHKTEKRKISLELVRLVHDRGGKFLRFDKETGSWYELDSKTTLIKAGQALRENLTAEDRKLKRLKYTRKN